MTEENKNESIEDPSFAIPVDMPTKGGFTKHEYAAIKLRVPESGTDWLDEMIKDSLRNEFAAKAMQAHLGDFSIPETNKARNNVALVSYRMADAMLAVRKL